jgi:hypothetical protein
MTNFDPAEQAILRLLQAASGSISPTDAARALAGDPGDDSWRRSLAPIHLAGWRAPAPSKFCARASRSTLMRPAASFGCGWPPNQPAKMLRRAASAKCTK